MKRYHLFEFEDLQWFPKFIRNYITDFLQFISNKMDVYQSITPVLLKGLKKSGHKKIVDLAAGGGGGWEKILPRLKEIIPELQITLTDYYPNAKAFKRMLKVDKESIKYVPESINALDVPKQLVGMRTQFLSFHHFNYEDAKNILQNAVDARMPIAVFEIQERNMEHVLKNIFSPIMVLLTAPFIQPFSIGRIIFTYLIPIVPLAVLWDGVVSVLRTYSVEEMKKMTTELKNRTHFKWEIEKVKDGPITVLYLLGYPK
ncbi:MAG: class I SAM-dependent methyltransferase [Bacteroidota bacterium]